MAQLILYQPDNSIADILLIPDALALELTRVLEYLKKEYLDLALLRDIKIRVLSIVSKILKEKNIQINNVQEVEAFAICTIDYFTFLLNLIYLIEQVPNSDSLTLCLSE